MKEREEESKDKEMKEINEAGQEKKLFDKSIRLEGEQTNVSTSTYENQWKESAKMKHEESCVSDCSIQNDEQVNTDKGFEEKAKEDEKTNNNKDISVDEFVLQDRTAEGNNCLLTLKPKDLVDELFHVALHQKNSQLEPSNDKEKEEKKDFGNFVEDSKMISEQTNAIEAKQASEEKPVHEENSELGGKPQKEGQTEEQDAKENAVTPSISETDNFNHSATEAKELNEIFNILKDQAQDKLDNEVADSHWTKYEMQEESEANERDRNEIEIIEQNVKLVKLEYEEHAKAVPTIYREGSNSRHEHVADTDPNTEAETVYQSTNQGNDDLNKDATKDDQNENTDGVLDKPEISVGISEAQKSSVAKVKDKDLTESSNKSESDENEISVENVMDKQAANDLAEKIKQEADQTNEDATNCIAAEPGNHYKQDTEPTKQQTEDRQVEESTEPVYGSQKLMEVADPEVSDVCDCTESNKLDKSHDLKDCTEELENYIHEKPNEQDRCTGLKQCPEMMLEEGIHVIEGENTTEAEKRDADQSLHNLGRQAGEPKEKNEAKHDEISSGEDFDSERCLKKNPDEEVPNCIIRKRAWNEKLEDPTRRKHGAFDQKDITVDGELSNLNPAEAELGTANKSDKPDGPSAEMHGGLNENEHIISENININEEINEDIGHVQDISQLVKKVSVAAKEQPKEASNSVRQEQAYQTISNEGRTYSEVYKEEAQRQKHITKQTTIKDQQDTSKSANDEGNVIMVTEVSITNDITETVEDGDAFVNKNEYIYDQTMNELVPHNKDGKQLEDSSNSFEGKNNQTISSTIGSEELVPIKEESRKGQETTNEETSRSKTETLIEGTDEFQAEKIKEGTTTPEIDDGFTKDKEETSELSCENLENSTIHRPDNAATVNEENNDTSLENFEKDGEGKNLLVTKSGSTEVAENNTSREASENTQKQTAIDELQASFSRAMPMDDNFSLEENTQKMHFALSDGPGQPRSMKNTARNIHGSRGEETFESAAGFTNNSASEDETCKSMHEDWCDSATKTDETTINLVPPKEEIKEEIDNASFLLEEPIKDDIPKVSNKAGTREQIKILPEHNGSEKRPLPFDENKEHHTRISAAIEETEHKIRDEMTATFEQIEKVFVESPQENAEAELKMDLQKPLDDVTQKFETNSGSDNICNVGQAKQHNDDSDQETYMENQDEIVQEGKVELESNSRSNVTIPSNPTKEMSTSDEGDVDKDAKDVGKDYEENQHKQLDKRKFEEAAQANLQQEKMELQSNVTDHDVKLLMASVDCEEVQEKREAINVNLQDDKKHVEGEKQAEITSDKVDRNDATEIIERKNMEDDSTNGAKDIASITENTSKHLHEDWCNATTKKDQTTVNQVPHKEEILEEIDNVLFSSGAPNNDNIPKASTKGGTGAKAKILAEDDGSHSFEENQEQHQPRASTRTEDAKAQEIRNEIVHLEQTSSEMTLKISQLEKVFIEEKVSIQENAEPKLKMELQKPLDAIQGNKNNCQRGQMKQHDDDRDQGSYPKDQDEILVKGEAELKPNYESNELFRDNNTKEMFIPDEGDEKHDVDKNKRDVERDYEDNQFIEVEKLQRAEVRRAILQPEEMELENSEKVDDFADILMAPVDSEELQREAVGVNLQVDKKQQVEHAKQTETASDEVHRDDTTENVERTNMADNGTTAAKNITTTAENTSHQLHEDQLDAATRTNQMTVNQVIQEQENVEQIAALFSSEVPIQKDIPKASDAESTGEGTKIIAEDDYAAKNPLTHYEKQEEHITITSTVARQRELPKIGDETALLKQKSSDMTGKSENLPIEEKVSPQGNAEVKMEMDLQKTLDEVSLKSKIQLEGENIQDGQMKHNTDESDQESYLEDQDDILLKAKANLEPTSQRNNPIHDSNPKEKSIPDGETETQDMDTKAKDAEEDYQDNQFMLVEGIEYVEAPHLQLPDEMDLNDSEKANKVAKSLMAALDHEKIHNKSEAVNINLPGNQVEHEKQAETKSDKVDMDDAGKKREKNITDDTTNEVKNIASIKDNTSKQLHVVESDSGVKLKENGTVSIPNKEVNATSLCFHPVH
ncbi:hypothetical protein AXF42_Ash004909 [Apostasia shenzhenica]|uniref:Uncharacterized protein n=1 Tax=Apostasia shenzhenica TaxID=1088818 RepID=A0A2I0B7Z3_9ASPA|nr:hypothetical protein AXF42_Ash004909 [Apostasia shenzhenica]